MKTASWFTPIPPGHIRVGISRSTPRGMPAGFKLYRALAPGPWFRSVSASEYLKLYGAILNALDPHAVLADIEERAAGQTPVLCCFERVGSEQWCHRSLVSVWLYETIALHVPELGHEEAAPDKHPLLPPATVPIDAFKSEAKPHTSNPQSRHRQARLKL